MRLGKVVGSVVATRKDPSLEGAKLLVDGRGATVADRPGGFWVGPTVFDDVKPGMPIATEEIFGPVLCIMKAKDLDEAIAIANRSEYGNASSIYTSNGKVAREYQLRIQAGMVGVNIGVAAPMAMFPFGGQKGSFFGDTKAHGATAIDAVDIASIPLFVGTMIAEAMVLRRGARRLAIERVAADGCNVERHVLNRRLAARGRYHQFLDVYLADAGLLREGRGDGVTGGDQRRDGGGQWFDDQTISRRGGIAFH